MNLSEIVYRYMLRGFARPAAQNLAAEDLILTKIAKSAIAEHVMQTGSYVPNPHTGHCETVVSPILRNNCVN